MHHKLRKSTKKQTCARAVQRSGAAPSSYHYHSEPFDKFREECGVFGVYGHPEASNLAYLGLYALQHRGQEGAGICSSDGRQLYLEKAMGLVADIFSEKRLKKLPGHIAIGHTICLLIEQQLFPRKA